MSKAKAYNDVSQKPEGVVEKLALVKKEREYKGNIYTEWRCYVNWKGYDIALKFNLDKTYEVTNKKGQKSDAYFGSGAIFKERKKDR